MYLLALETSSARGSVALCSGENLVEELPFPEGLVHGREVSARIRDLVAGNGLRPRDLGAIGVSVGPGSYTGIRVGVTAAKTLSFALHLPLVPVSSLLVIAENVMTAGSSAEAPAAGASLPDQLIVLIDGKQRHLYHGLFSLGGAAPERSGEDRLIDLKELDPDRDPGFPAGALLVGNGAGPFLESFFPDGAGPYSRGPCAWDWPRAAGLGRCAVRHLESNQALRAGGAAHGAVPVYLRPSEAERKLAARGGPGRQESATGKDGTPC